MQDTEQHLQPPLHWGAPRGTSPAWPFSDPHLPQCLCNVTSIPLLFPEPRVGSCCSPSPGFGGLGRSWGSHLKPGEADSMLCGEEWKGRHLVDGQA